MNLKIRISRTGDDSMTRQLTDQLGGLITSGTLEIGSLLPSERTLAKSLGIARNVVRGSYEYLEQAGVVQREGKKGRRVRSATLRKKATTRRAAKKVALKRDA